MKWGRRKDEKPGTDLVPAGEYVDSDVVEEEDVEEVDDSDFIWRCLTCGAMGTSRESLHTHLGKPRRGRFCEPTKIREYVLRVEQEYETKQAEVSASGIWLIVKMPASTPEGEIKMPRRADDVWPTTVIEAASGLTAIQQWYREFVDDLSSDATDAERAEANGRYVALDFFTGHRAEALIESEWRANVEVAEGSHVEGGVA